MFKGVLLAVAVVGFSAGVAARADQISATFNTGLGCASTSCGTLTITDVSGGVTVTESLGSNFFVVTGHDGNHPSLALDLDTVPTSWTGFSGLPTGESWDVHTSADPAGYKSFDYDYYISLSASGGSSSPHVSTLSFTINGVTTADFDLNSPFVTDINDVADDGKTGNVSGVGTLSVTPAVPEPSSLALLGTGVLGAAGVLRRKFLRS